MSVHPITRIAAILIIAASWMLMALLYFHVVDWGQYP
jgi:hypothetical protein